MWIVFRLVLAVIAFSVRQLGLSGRLRGAPTTVGDQTVLVAVHKHKSRIVGYSVGVELKASIWFRLHRETAADRWFKWLGLSTEIETRDRAFDDLIYIVCDHPMFSALLKRSAEARRLISELLGAGVTRIDYDGQAVWCFMPGEPSEAERSLVAELGQALKPLERDSSRRLSDPFVWKALVVEGLVWSIAAYGVGAYLEMAFHTEDIHLDRMDLIWPGLAMGAVLFGLLGATVVFLLRGSSRGHRLLLESAALLLLGLPFTGIQVFADLNRGLDTSEVNLHATVAGCQTRVSTSYRRGRKRTSTSYHVRLSGTEGNIALPQEIRVSQEVCRAAKAGSQAVITLGQGAFGKPWYRRISVGGATWSP